MRRGTKSVAFMAVVMCVSVAAQAGTILSSDFTGIEDFGAGDLENYEYFTGHSYTSDYDIAVAMPFRPAGLIGEDNQPQPGDLFSLAGKTLYSSTEGFYDGAIRIAGIPTSEGGWRGPSLSFDGKADHTIEEISIDVAIGMDFDGIEFWTGKTMDYAIEITTDDRTVTILDYAATEFNNFMPGDGFATLTWDLSDYLAGQDLALDASKTYELRIAMANWSGTTSQFRVGVMDNLVITGVPEPATLVLLGLGSLVLRRRR